MTRWESHYGPITEAALRALPLPYESYRKGPAQHHRALSREPSTTDGTQALSRELPSSDLSVKRQPLSGTADASTHPPSLWFRAPSSTATRLTQQEWLFCSILNT